MKWTRFFRTTGASLPLAVEVEIRGIPPNAWEFPTAELLLDENCSIVVVHPSTEDRRDVFQLKAWCSNPDGFPSMMDLETVEPHMEADQQLGRRTMKYPISIAVSRLASSNSDDAPPPPPVVDEDGSRRRRRRRSCSLSIPMEQPAGAVSSSLGGRGSAHPGLVGSPPPGFLGLRVRH